MAYRNTKQNDARTVHFNEENSENSEYNEHGNEFENQGSENKMARSYATVASENVNNSKDNQTESVKPVFIQEQDIFGTTNPPKQYWLKHVEIYKALGQTIKPQCIKGIQRIAKMWRIYIDNEPDRLKLLIEGVILRDKKITLLSQNPRNPSHVNITRVKVKNVPLSADDGQIERAITKRNTNVEMTAITRERLRVDNKLTNCETGDRFVFCKNLNDPLPKIMKMGKYTARVYHIGQPRDLDNNTFICSKCLQNGHSTQNCTNDWKCRNCNMYGHKMLDCPDFLDKMFSKDMENETEDIADSQTTADTQTTTDTQTTIDTDTEEDSDEETQSQSILQPAKTQQDSQGSDKPKSRKKKGGQHKSAKSNPEHKGQNDDYINKSKDNTSKVRTKTTTSSVSKQTDMTSFVTPQRSNVSNTRRTPPTPPSRGANKLPKN